MPCNKLVDTKHKDFWLRIKFRCGEIIGNKERLCLECKNKNNNPLDIKPGNGVTKAKIQKPTLDKGTKLGGANSIDINLEDVSR